MLSTYFTRCLIAKLEEISEKFYIIRFVYYGNTDILDFDYIISTNFNALIKKTTKSINEFAYCQMNAL